tara:strand:+ start:100 stop:813 length:714 start_codon:yes stop_codon:yes gene_type:complete
MSKDIKKIFICGCGHTGTTILARIIGNHSKIYLINFETGAYLLNRHYKRNKLLKKYIRFAKKNKKRFILEKTPRHIWHLDYINRITKNSKFILTTRNPKDTIYSLYKRYKNIDKAIIRYQDDSIQTIRFKNFKNSCLIKYEDLKLNPKRTLKKICKFLKLKYEENMLNFYQNPVEWNLSNPFAKGKDLHNVIRNKQVNLPLDTTFKINKIPKKIERKITDFVKKKNIGYQIKKNLNY